MNQFGQVKRFFSISSSACARTYKQVVQRNVKQVINYTTEDVKPQRLRIPETKPEYPPYPFGESHIFKRSNRGLFGGQFIATGNKVSEFKNKTRRTFLPNVIKKRVWSETLNQMLQINMTTRVLRTITKEGGLDNYVLKEKPARVKELGPFGWKLKYDILKQQKLNKKAEYLKNNYAEVANGGSKVYFKGTYKGQEVQLTVGRRKLIHLLFPVVKENTVHNLSFAPFNNSRRHYTFDELLKEMETYDMNIDAIKL